MTRPTPPRRGATPCAAPLATGAVGLACCSMLGARVVLTLLAFLALLPPGARRAHFTGAPVVRGAPQTAPGGALAAGAAVARARLGRDWGAIAAGEVRPLGRRRGATEESTESADDSSSRRIGA